MVHLPQPAAVNPGIAYIVHREEIGQLSADQRKDRADQCGGDKHAAQDFLRLCSGRKSPYIEQENKDGKGNAHDQTA